MPVIRTRRPMLEQGDAIDPAGSRVGRYGDLQRVPLPPGDGQVGACPFHPLVVDEGKQHGIVFQGVDPENPVVAGVAQPEDQTAGLVDAARHRLDLEGKGSVAHRPILVDGQGEGVIGADGVEHFLVGPAQGHGHQLRDTGGERSQRA